MFFFFSTADPSLPTKLENKTKSETFLQKTPWRWQHFWLKRFKFHSVPVCFSWWGCLCVCVCVCVCVCLCVILSLCTWQSSGLPLAFHVITGRRLAPSFSKGGSANEEECCVVLQWQHSSLRPYEPFYLLSRKVEETSSHAQITWNTNFYILVL